MLAESYGESWEKDLDGVKWVKDVRFKDALLALEFPAKTPVAAVYTSLLARLTLLWEFWARTISAKDFIQPPSFVGEPLL